MRLDIMVDILLARIDCRDVRGHKLIGGIELIQESGRKFVTVNTSIVAFFTVQHHRSTTCTLFIINPNL